MSEGRKSTKHDFRDDLGSANLTYPPVSANNLYISSKLTVSGGKTDLSLSSINKSPTWPVCIERRRLGATEQFAEFIIFLCLCLQQKKTPNYK